VKRSIAAVTFARSDWSSLGPVVSALRSRTDVDAKVIVSGMHLAPEFGSTVNEVEEAGAPISERIEMLLSSDTAEGMVVSAGLGTIGFGHAFARTRPDLLLVVGDRFELLALTAAALAFRIPLGHISGGDVTLGAIDNQVRDCVSVASSLHFVAMEAHRDRLLQMGEEPWRVHVFGDPALDCIYETDRLDRRELAETLNIDLSGPVVVVTYHPVTGSEGSSLAELEAMLQALQELDATLIITYPNADAEGRSVLARLRVFAGSRGRTLLVTSLGRMRYYSLLHCADLMVGNSSSAIWEAPSFALPAVDIGDRQKGRTRIANVIHSEGRAEAISAAIQRGLSPEFRESLRGVTNPYGGGGAAARIAEVLATAELSPRLLEKQFCWRAGA
jgi:UDP-N-acetylglucosamine 2-epimerase (non-hydrolysing)/GDP/UDP-N,N'-diacetylbacillosamine 2-epimerase (hydrolysing)